MEFKLQDANKGLQQMKDRGYAHSYYNSTKEVVLMSIIFNQEKRYSSRLLNAKFGNDDVFYSFY